MSGGCLGGGFAGANAIRNADAAICGPRREEAGVSGQALAVDGGASIKSPWSMPVPGPATKTTTTETGDRP